MIRYLWYRESQLLFPDAATVTAMIGSEWQLINHRTDPPSGLVFQGSWGACTESEKWYKFSTRYLSCAVSLIMHCETVRTVRTWPSILPSSRMTVSYFDFDLRHGRLRPALETMISIRYSWVKGQSPEPRAQRQWQNRLHKVSYDGS